MKRSKTFLVLSFVALATCNREALDPDTEVVEAVVVSPSVTTVSIGATANLTAQVLGLNGVALDDRPVYWASEDNSVATVGADGKVTAHSIGS